MWSSMRRHSGRLSWIPPCRRRMAKSTEDWPAPTNAWREWPRSSMNHEFDFPRLRHERHSNPHEIVFQPAAAVCFTADFLRHLCRYFSFALTFAALAVLLG